MAKSGEPRYAYLEKTFLSVIQSKVIYGIFLYGTASKTNLKLLTGIQSEAQRIVLGALRCTQNEHLNIINIMPIKTLIKHQLAKFTLRVVANKDNPLRDTLMDFQAPSNLRGLRYPKPLCQRIQMLFENLPFHYRDIEAIPYNLKNQTFYDYASDSLHKFAKDTLTPQNWQQLHAELIHNYQKASIIYTDGSVNKDKSGCGIYNINFQIKTRIPDLSTIFTAEVYSIFLAITYVVNHYQSGVYLILTDSLSAIFALKAAHNSKHHLVLKIASLLSNLKNHRIAIQWIPSHMGITGNELADSLAKDSLNLSYITQLRFNVSEADKIITSHYQKTLLEICQP